ncbi:metallophosphoesterase family protein [Terriglobus albidus]|uniref:metallophosphoesterase family protein n=1 Tax=Terriglobus albidus TaxID=1592106 RepID=UPI0021DFBC94|nr:metallophosphoesterase [Terriglobus albidus]
MATATLPVPGWAKRVAAVPDNAFSFVFLGDLHFDKLMHHDMGYLKDKYPNDIHQIENYSRITRENLASLMQVSRECAKETDASFLLQIGDFVEGLCGSKELASTQVNEFIDLVDRQQFGLPFLAIKGNHDITGTGAKEVYQEIVLPWQSRQLNRPATTANNMYVHKNARFILFDCFSEKESLVWLREAIKEHKKSEVLFFCTHVPVVPYDARSNWHVYVHPNQATEREELLNLLGEHKAVVLSGHLHKTSIVTRNTPSGNFVQIGLGSVVPSLDAPVKSHLKGLDAYSERLVELEPDFTPSTLELRKQILKEEKPFIRHYEYADFCGYSSVHVGRENNVSMTIYANASKTPWSQVNITELFRA